MFNDSKNKNLEIARKFLAKNKDSGLSLDEILEIKEAFDFIDKDSSEKITRKEINQARKLLLINNENQEDNEGQDIFNELLIRMDLRKTEQATFDDFIDLFVNEKDKTSREYYSDLFYLFTKEDNSKDKLTFDDLKKIVEHIQEDISTQELKQMFERADKDNDGLVGKNEFIEFMTAN